MKKKMLLLTMGKGFTPFTHGDLIIKASYRCQKFFGQLSHSENYRNVLLDLLHETSAIFARVITNNQLPGPCRPGSPICIKFSQICRPQQLLGIIASEAKGASASARSKLYLTYGYGYLEKSCISETKHFGHMVLGTKSDCFDQISRYTEWTDPTRPDPARPDPARPSRFWEAYNSETVDYTEKSFQT